MVSAAERELEGAGVKDRPEVVLADAGYWSNAHINALRERGMTPIVAPDTTRSRPRKTRLGGPYDFMRTVMATEKGDDLYKRRHGRAGLRPDQDQPADGALQTTRPRGRPVGMAPDDRHSQSTEAPPAHLAGSNRLIEGFFRTSLISGAASRHGQIDLCATASREGVALLPFAQCGSAVQESA